MPRSMTGFARQELQLPGGQLICEIRSVNHRYLEPSLRLSESLRSLEPSLRDMLRKLLSRGKVEVGLFFKAEESDAAGMTLDAELARQVAQMAEQVDHLLVNPAPLNAMDILRWPGVIKVSEMDQATVAAAAQRLFATTLKLLSESRAREGVELAQFIEQRLQAIAGHVAQVRKRVPELQAHQQEKLRAKLAVLAAEVDEDRLTQELVYLAQKTDVAEELDRLEAHLTEVRHTLKQTEPIGRRLDFLMQELNREANTLSSKSIASDTSQTAVDLKVLIEQMREQVQNIE